MTPLKLTLLSRSFCHLCTDMQAALAPLADEFGVAVEVLDVDDHPQLVERYDELVPVLLHDGVELCHYFLDVSKVRAHLCALQQSSPRPPSPPPPPSSPPPPSAASRS
jgi:thioredoxin reductase (NADPH)